MRSSAWNHLFCKCPCPVRLRPEICLFLEPAGVQGTHNTPADEACCCVDTESLQKLPWHINRKIYPQVGRSDQIPGLVYGLTSSKHSMCQETYTTIVFEALLFKSTSPFRCRLLFNCTALAMCLAGSCYHAAFGKWSLGSAAWVCSQVALGFEQVAAAAVAAKSTTSLTADGACSVGGNLLRAAEPGMPLGGVALQEGCSCQVPDVYHCRRRALLLGAGSQAASTHRWVSSCMQMAMAELQLASLQSRLPAFKV